MHPPAHTRHHAIRLGKPNDTYSRLRAEHVPRRPASACHCQCASPISRHELLVLASAYMPELGGGLGPRPARPTDGCWKVPATAERSYLAPDADTRPRVGGVRFQAGIGAYARCGGRDVPRLVRGVHCGASGRVGRGPVYECGSRQGMASPSLVYHIVTIAHADDNEYLRLTLHGSKRSTCKARHYVLSLRPTQVHSPKPQSSTPSDARQVPGGPSMASPSCSRTTSRLYTAKVPPTRIQSTLAAYTDDPFVLVPQA